MVEPDVRADDSKTLGCTCMISIISRYAEAVCIRDQEACGKESGLWAWMLLRRVFIFSFAGLFRGKFARHFGLRLRFRLIYQSIGQRGQVYAFYAFRV